MSFKTHFFNHDCVFFRNRYCHAVCAEIIFDQIYSIDFINIKFNWSMPITKINSLTHLFILLNPFVAMT